MFHQLTNNVHNICNVRTNHYQINEDANKLPLKIDIIKRNTLLRCQVDIGIKKCWCLDGVNDTEQANRSETFGLRKQVTIKTC